ncbi:MAG: rRNA maturation RNase YbeY [Acidimicrobiales bacterium]|nr:rRNA maturation RNase YbeY [Acidimicrobiales bacterium]
MSGEPPQPGPVAGPTVIVDDERDDPDPAQPVDVSRWEALVADVLFAEGLGDRLVEVHLHFVDEPSIEVLNRDHMNGSGPTDVLAFPVDDLAEVPVDVPVLLGDVVVCPSVAARQAPEHAGDYHAELALLVVHGVLHLLGDNHADPEQAAAMQTKERGHLARHGVERP